MNQQRKLYILVIFISVETETNRSIIWLKLAITTATSLTLNCLSGKVDEKYLHCYLARKRSKSRGVVCYLCQNSFAFETWQAIELRSLRILKLFLIQSYFGDEIDGKMLWRMFFLLIVYFLRMSCYFQNCVMSLIKLKDSFFLPKIPQFVSTFLFDET